jgi:hypothetical protein
MLVAQAHLKNEVAVVRVDMPALAVLRVLLLLPVVVLAAAAHIYLSQAVVAVLDYLVEVQTVLLDLPTVFVLFMEKAAAVVVMLLLALPDYTVVAAAARAADVLEVRLQVVVL